MTRRLRTGKLPAELLDRLLRTAAQDDQRLLVGPRIGEDAAAIAVGPTVILATADPITFVAADIGAYVVDVNVNDIATMGGEPRWFFAVLLLPEREATEEMAEALFGQIGEACRSRGCTLAGGHTEVTAGLPRPLVVGFLLGEVEPGGLLSTAGAKEGDSLLLTKGIAIEATSILAREKGEAIRTAFGEEFLARCRRMLAAPGISILSEARIARGARGVHALHDPTEGGLAQGLHELAVAAGVGLIVEEERIPILPETAALAEALGFDPLGAIASGSLLIAVAAEGAGPLRSALRGAGIEVAEIGRTLPRSEGVRLWRGGELIPLPRFPQDEMTRVLGEEAAPRRR